MKKFGLLLAVTLISVAVAVVVLIPKPKAAVEIGQAPPNLQGELDPKIWGQVYPDEYASYLKNAEITQGNSKYRGSAPFSYLEKYPAVKRFFAGMAFSVEYNNKRSHIYAIEDVTGTKRVSSKTTAACFTCKSPNVPKQISEQGDAFYAKPFNEVKSQMIYSVSCADCHDGASGKLKVTRQPFLDALKAMGKDPNNLTQQELRSAVCGQCHSSYYLNPDTKKVIFPWKFGLKASDMENYYRSTKFTEWTHPESKSQLIKARHPEYETWSESVHAAKNVACPDCHMPKEQVGDKTISSHHWQSPLNTLKASCSGCHQASGLREQVISIQDQVFAKRQEAEKAINAAIDSIAAADKNSTAEPYNIMVARAMHRKAQWRWDFVASENSMGFHNPAEAMALLDEAIQFAKEAQDYANTAAKYPRKPDPKQPDSGYGSTSFGQYMF